MKKVIILIGSPRKQATYRAAQEFVADLKSYMEIDCEYVLLNNYHLEYCKGCKLCFDKGEEYCPSKDDRDLLLDKINQSDGLIFATPNYLFHVTALLKNFLDRVAFISHRPRFFGKACTVLVTQGITGGASIVKYLENIGGNLGFHVSKGCCINTLEPETERQREKASKKIRKASTRFYRELTRSTLRAPSVFRLMMFRISRTSIRTILNEDYRDYHYYKEKGWFESDYYDEVPLNPGKKLAGRFFDFLGKQIAGYR